MKERGNIMKKWRCTVCGYIYEGPEPPAVCPLCKAPASKFELIEDDEAKKEPTLEELMFNLSYGLYVVTAKDGDRLNGMISNSFVQLTSEPIQATIGINKNNFTNHMIKNSGTFGISILNTTNHDLVPRFGYVSGRDQDKFADFEDYEIGEKTGVPGIKSAICFLELEVEQVIDCGTHDLFIAKVVGGKQMAGGEPMTYAYYRKTR